MKYKRKAQIMSLQEMYKESEHNREYRNKTHFSPSTGSSTYGEITQRGANTLMSKFDSHFNKDAVFYDLGCGLGKFVIHVANARNIKKSVGIEYSRERFAGCLALKSKYGAKDNITFLNKSYLDHNFSDATIVYLDNTCHKEASQKIYDKLPTGCLLLLKNSYRLSADEEIHTLDCIDRTYHQNGLCWLIKN